MRPSQAAGIATIAFLVLAGISLLVLDESEGAVIEVPVLTPEATYKATVREGTGPVVRVGDLLGYAGVDATGRDIFCYGHDGTIAQVMEGSALTVKEGRLERDGSAVIGLALSGGGGISTLMDLYPGLSSALNLSTPRSSAIGSTSVERVIVLELDGLGNHIHGYASRDGFTGNISSLGNISAALTAYPPITNVGTAMALTGHPPSANGIMARADHSLRKPTFLETAQRQGLNTLWIEGDVRFLDADMLNVQGGDGMIFSELERGLMSGDDLVMAHFHGIDDAMHDQGPISPGTMEAIRTVDSWIGHVATTIEEQGVPTLLVLFSDHGGHRTDEGGAHGSFVSEDMYSIVAWKAYGGEALPPPPALTVRSKIGTVAELDMGSLRALPSQTGEYVLRSSSYTETSTFTGVSVAYLIDLVGEGPGGVVVEASDGYATFIRAEWASDTRVIIAYDMDGSPMTGTDELRLIVPQDLAGEYNAQYCVKHVISVEVRE